MACSSTGRNESRSATSSKPGDVLLTLSSGATLTCDGVLVCAGRSSNTANLNLAAAGITPGKRGLVVVDEHFRSTVPHIYAAGDVGLSACAGRDQRGTGARRDLPSPSTSFLKKDIASILPTGIYTIPEASMVGETEESLKEKKIDYLVGRAHARDNRAGRSSATKPVFLKLIFRRDSLRLARRPRRRRTAAPELCSHRPGGAAGWGGRGNSLQPRLFQLLRRSA